MRYGTRSIVARKWMSCGYRPSCPMKYGYSYGYLFQACQPATGRTFEMYLPNMSGTCFKLFIRCFAKAFPGQTMIMDNAGCHHVSWEEDEPGNQPDIDLQYLSAYSPDFNPQERLFQEIKKTLKSKIYDDLKAIEQDINQTLQYFWAQPDKVQRLTAWDWIN